MRCLEKKPEHRYQTMSEIEADLARIGVGRAPLGPDTVTLKPPEPGTAARARVAPTYVGGLSVALLALLGALALSAWREHTVDGTEGSPARLEPAASTAPQTPVGSTASPAADEADEALAAADKAPPVERQARRARPVRRKPKTSAEAPQKHDTAILDPWE
jgi:hypothetical protein